MVNVSMKWIDEVRGKDSIREVARRVGMNQGTLNRQINLDQLSFETVRAVCREYELPVIPALVSTGHLSREDAGIDAAATALRSATDEQIVEEVARRLRVSSMDTAYDVPVSEVLGNVTHMRPNVGGNDQALGEVAFESDIDHSQDTDDYHP
ncbi:hypothetical protein [Microbacterium album]|uniref:HTH cro/C1-type domain-containing protein n=1 Tax=Microbacterium album TaxID=2053191 RepID=A0A917MK11_9MICO|nr:hypothetical protein [Microbacterium album]GGH33930.1 hypothetical protein GCM10010921_01240 [Microbacterium album]